MNFFKLLTVFVLFFFTTAIIQPGIFAQDIDYLEDEGGSLWDEQEFLDVTGQDSEFQTQDNQYVGEEEIQAAEEQARRAGLPTIDLAAALERDQEMLPDNIMYGVGTGALIGGWFALVEGGTARDNVRFLTIGVLAGVLLGVMIGNKTLLIDQQPSVFLDPVHERKSMTNALAEAPMFQPSLELTPSSANLSFEMKF